MALFKIFKGEKNDLQAGKPNAVEGYVYFTTDEHKFYIDITSATTAIIAEDGNRVPLNAYKADTLSQTLPISLGGTSATSALEALENLGGLSLLKNGHSLNNTDINNLEHGAYFSSNATATQTISGSVPFISGFTLYQIKGYAGQSKMQFASQGKKALKFRYYSDSTWSNWETISMLSDIPTTLPASDVSDWAKADTKPSYYLSEILNATNINAIESITNTSGFLKKTGTNTWELDTNTYITSYTSQTKNYVLAAPSDSNGIPAFRKLVAADIPNLNASKINDGTLNFSRLPTMYWANIAITTNSSNTQTPIFGSITLNDTTLTKGVNLLTLSNNEVSYYTFRTESFGPTNNKSGQIDLGSSTYKWRNLYLAGDITAANTTLSGTLNVTGQSYLNNNVTVDGQITTNELIIQGQGSAQTPTAAQHIATKGYVDNAISQGTAAQVGAILTIGSYTYNGSTAINIPIYDGTYS